MATRQLGIEKGNFKRSIDGIFNVFTSLRNRKGSDNDGLRNALYNFGLMSLLFVLFALFMILRPFLKPLVSAFLVSAALFPLKRRVAHCILKWIDKVEREETPIVVGIALIPFSGLKKIGEIITRFTLSHIKFIFMSLSSLVLLRLLIQYVPKDFFTGILYTIVWLHSIFGNITSSLSPSMLLILVICYVFTVKLMWNATTSNTFVIFSQGLYMLIIGYLTSYLGALQIPAFISIMIYCLIALIYFGEDNNGEIIHKIRNKFKSNEKEQKNEEEIKYEQTPMTSSSATPMSRLMKTKTHLSEIKNKMQLNVPQESNEKDPAIEKGKNKPLESDGYFKLLFYACTATVLFKHLWIVFLSFIPISVYAITSLCKALGLWNHIETQFSQHFNKLKDWFEPRKFALMPVCLPAVLQLNKKVHKIFCEKFKNYVHDISASIMILIMIIGAVALSVFSFVQIYSEALTVAQLGGNVINRTLTLKPELVESLPMMQNFNDVIDNAYQYSRGTIENYLDSALNGTNEDQAVKLKAQIISLFDRLVQSYMDLNNNDNQEYGPRVTSESVFDTLNEIFSSSGGYSSLIAWAKSNLGTMKEISDSVLSIIMTNLSLVFSVLATFFGVIIGSGHVMLSLLFNTIIFFTTLYYLLQASHDRFVLMNMNTSNSPLGLRLAEALESSVSSVLFATLKLSLFHGLFTWLTHTLFGAHVVYLPAFISSLLAMAPFLETYWCSIPAFLDLWLSQDRFYLGLVLVAIHFIIPPNFNVVIHSEIQGSGHPYLTGLSIAGGIYVLSLEGAIVGPLLLCILIVLYDVTINSLASPTSTNLTRQSSSEESNMIASPSSDWEFAKRMQTNQHDSTI